MVKDDGSVFTLKNAICMHEEDASICWKHTDWRTGVPAVARNRKLVVSFICTIANYEYVSRIQMLMYCFDNVHNGCCMFC